MPAYEAIATALVLVVVLLAILLARMFRTIPPGEEGVLFTFGAYRGTLRPGFHAVTPIGMLIRVSMGPRTETVGPFSTPSRDGHPMTVSARVDYRVSDAKRSVYVPKGPAGAVQEATRAALALTVAALDAAGLAGAGPSASDRALAAVAETTAKIGLTIDRFTLILPGAQGPVEFPAQPATPLK